MATDPIRNHKHYANRERPIRGVLIAIVVVAIASLSTDVLAQRGSSPLLSRNLSDENTVSTNQLLTPSKALHAAQRARNHLITGRIDQAQKEVTSA
jgi:hypothetical protein